MSWHNLLDDDPSELAATLKDMNKELFAAKREDLRAWIVDRHPEATAEQIEESLRRCEAMALKHYGANVDEFIRKRLH